MTYEYNKIIFEGCRALKLIALLFIHSKQSNIIKSNQNTGIIILSRRIYLNVYLLLYFCFQNRIKSS